MKITHYGLSLLLSLFLSTAYAVDQAPSEVGDAAANARYWDLLSELRCVVCQNQSLADSNASLAQDLREEVKEMFMKGLSNEEITAFLVKRYGEFVLYRPPVTQKTYVLWGGPFLLLLIGLLVLIYFVRRHGRDSQTVGGTLSDAEQQRLDALLTSKPDSKQGK